MTANKGAAILLLSTFMAACGSSSLQPNEERDPLAPASYTIAGVNGITSFRQIGERSERMSACTQDGQALNANLYIFLSDSDLTRGDIDPPAIARDIQQAYESMYKQAVSEVNTETDKMYRDEDGHYYLPSDVAQRLRDQGYSYLNQNYDVVAHLELQPPLESGGSCPANLTLNL